MSKPTFKDWYKVVPVEKNDTTSYNLRRAYEIAPKEELDAFANSDAHLHSVYKNPKTGEYEFMKSVSHPSLLLELADYNSNPEFNQRYGVVPDGTYLKYVPYASGGSIHIKPENRNEFTALEVYPGFKQYGPGGWLKELLLDKAASKAADFAGGLLTKDEVKTILEHPTDYAEYLGWDKDTINEKKRNFYRNSVPWGYDLLSARDAIGGNKGQDYPLGTTLSEKMARDYLFAEYLGIPQKERKEPLAHKMFETSPYKPSMGGDDENYIRFSTDYNRNKIVDIYNNLLSNVHYTPGSSKMKAGRDYMTSFGNSIYRIEPGKSGNNLVVSSTGAYDFNMDPYTATLGQYTLGTGYDNSRGQYISVYDRWDLNPLQYSMYPLPKILYKKFGALGDASGGFGKPVNFYDRVYLDDYYGVDSRPKSPDEFYGGYIVPAVVTADKAEGGKLHKVPEPVTHFSAGGSIHINPANRGKFNATKARTGKTTEELTHSKNPLTRKRAIFSQNAAKWNHKHAGGGFLLDAPEYPADEEQTRYARDAKSSYGDTYYDIVNSRYTGAMNALKRKGFSYADAERLAPMIVTQNNLEGGWRLNRADNNFGGMRKNGKILSFNSVDDFYDAYIDMLDEKWNAGTSPHSSWRHTRNLDEWAKVLNHEDLNLWSKERWEAYNREHKDEPVYLYAPQWENNNKTYREHLRGVEDRTSAYLDMVRRDNPVKNWDIQPEETPVQRAAKENPSLLLALINKLRGK